MPVRVVECVGHLARDPHRVVHRELLLAAEPVAERLALDEGHDVIEEGVGLTRVEERENVRMLKIGGELDLGEEPLGADYGGQFRAQHLERNAAVVPQVLGQINGRHAARADLALETVVKGECARDSRG